MPRKSRVVSPAEEQMIRESSALVAPLVIRLARTFVACVTAPNRSENQEQEQRFVDALGDSIIALAESGAFDK